MILRNLANRFNLSQFVIAKIFPFFRGKQLPLRLLFQKQFILGFKNLIFN